MTNVMLYFSRDENGGSIIKGEIKKQDDKQIFNINPIQKEGSNQISQITEKSLKGKDPLDSSKDITFTHWNLGKEGFKSINWKLYNEDVSIYL